MNKNIEKTLEKIAETCLGIETLETRKSDSLDFYTVSVWGVKDALHKAYREGKKSVMVGENKMGENDNSLT